MAQLLKQMGLQEGAEARQDLGLHDSRIVASSARAKKVHTVFSQLEAKGTTKEQLARVQVPIGLAIGTETPEEIAVSIMAEIVQVRRQLENSKQTSK